MSWVDDFSSFQSSTDVVPGGQKKAIVTKSPTKKEQLEAELKLLEWHKLANDAAIKAALMQTKSMRKELPSKPPGHTSEDARWMRKVIEQEHVKPLEVSRNFVLEYEMKEKENAERLSTQVNRHISTLQTLRQKLEARNDLKSRTDEYRKWQKSFSVKKQAVMIGKTLNEIEMPDEEDDDGRGSNGMNISRQGSSGTQGRGDKNNELTSVLDSLGKLAELERRITTLEKDNEYDFIMQKEKPSVLSRTSFEFRKKRAPLAENAPASSMGIKYALNTKKTPWNKDIQGVGGNGMAAVRAKQNGGVFLTGMDDGEGHQLTGEDRREMLKRERQKQLALASAGKKAVHSRVHARKDRVKEQSLGAQRHDQAMKELNRRRNEQLLKKKGKPVVQAGKGASAGVKHKNKHLQDFEALKSNYKKRKDDIQNKFKLNTTDDRIASHSAPAGRGANNRIPAVKHGGTVTRRTDQPNRRGNKASNDVSGFMTAPSGVVGGIGGIKALRNKR